MKDVNVGMKINLDTLKISHSIDGDEYFDAPIAIKQNEYRLAVAMFGQDDEME